MPLFSLEALAALHGDCLLLHYGTVEKPRLVLIDGGPPQVYGNALKPRLDQLRERRADERGVLPLTLAMVSHIDADHIQGLLDLTEELAAANEAGQRPLVTATTLWHNSFQDLSSDGAAVASLGEEPEVEKLSTDPEVPKELRQAAAVVASVGQGRRLRDAAAVLGWPLNHPFDELVMAPEQGGFRVDLGAKASLLVVAPNAKRVDALRQQWQRQVERARKAEAKAAAIAAYIDQSVYNLSSIVCLAEAGKHRILLTGDARGDDILGGLAAAGRLDEGKIEVDVLKLPHHGSDHNIAADFFEAIRARHYVLSGDGKQGNPELGTLQMLCEVRKDDDFTLHFTYHEGIDGLGAKIDGFLAKQRAAGRGFEVEFREDPALSLRIDLLDPLPD